MISKFVELPVVFANPDFQDFSSMGIESDDHGFVDVACIDLLEIQSFYKCLNPETEKSDSTKLNMKTTGEYFTVKINYDRFKAFYEEQTEHGKIVKI